MITKRTVDECLEEYLNSKDIDKDTKEKIMNSLYDKIGKELIKQKNKAKKERAKKRKEKSKVSHGTSCPRIMTKTGDLIIEL